MIFFFFGLISSESDRDFVISIYNRLNKRLLGYAYHLSGDVQWARDATQQIFLVVMDRIQYLTQFSDDKIAAYCFTIMRNNFTRRNKQNSREESLDIQDIEIEDDEQVEDTVFSRLERSEVKAAVQKLSEQHRMIITLRFGLNRTHAEIAEEMGISVSYSQNLLAAAIRQLRQTLGVGVNNNHEEV